MESHHVKPSEFCGQVVSVASFVNEGYQFTPPEQYGVRWCEQLSFSISNASVTCPADKPKHQMMASLKDWSLIAQQWSGNRDVNFMESDLQPDI